LHNDVVAWPPHAGAPMNKDAIFRHILPMIAAFQSPGVTIELKPLSIRVFGNVGIAQYQADIQLTPMRDTGEKLRFTRTWLRSEDGWRLIAGMSAPVPGS
jgi:ketosteroid isomerase-like protein